MSKTELEIVGKKYGKLTALYNTKKKYKTWYIWKFGCECGRNISVPAARVVYGTTRSCGCLKSDSWKKVITKHSMRYTRFYRVYQNMISRCRYKKHQAYDRYGGRGIKCEWASFDDFKKDMYQSYLLHSAKFGEKQTTIDRVDNNGNYCKENCRWATMKEQGYNKSDTLIVRVGDYEGNLKEVSELLGITPNCLYQRISKTKNNYGVLKTK